MRRNFIFFLACWFLAATAFGQVLNEPFTTTSLPAGWTGSSFAGSGWEFTPSSVDYGVANTPDHTPGGGTNFALVDFSTFPGGRDSNAILTAPGVSVATLANPILSFAYESYYVGTNTNFIFNTIDVEAWNGMMWVNITTLQGNTPQGWEVLTYPITPALTYSGGDSVRVRFVADDGGDPDSYENDLLIDDVMVMEQPTCFAPNGVTASNITATSASIAWMQPMGTPIGWEVGYGAPMTPPGSAGSVFSATMSANLTGLMSNAPYNVYVRAICAPGDTSAWSSAANVRTLCASVAPPYLYDFTDFIDNNPCWSEATGVLTPNSNLSYGSSSWVEDGFGNNGGIDAAKMNIYASRAEWLISESIDLGSGTAYQLEFDVALTDFASTAATTLGADDTAAVVISTDNGVTWSNANALRMWTAGSEPSNTGDHVIIDLSAYSGVVKIGFYAYSSVTAGADNDFFIDNFEIAPLANCLPPSMVGATNITPTSADLGWMTNSGATMWQIEYGPAGFTPGSGTRQVTMNNPFSLTGLSPSTDYEFYVRSICAPGDTSSWSSVVPFSTLCLPASVPYLYAFIDYIDNNPCWSEATGALTANSNIALGTSQWGEDGFGNVGTVDAAGINVYGSRDAWLITESLDLGTGTAYQAEFDVALTDFASTSAGTFDADDAISFLISTDNGVTWSNANVLRTWAAGNEPSNTGDHIIVDLTAYSGTVKFAFHVRSTTINGDNDFFVDNFEIAPLSTCLPPSMLMATNVTATSADLSWMTSSGATMWEIEYGPTGFTPGSGTRQVTTNNPLSLTGLMPTTGYEFYVRSICAPGDTSIWSPVANFTTPCAPATVPYLYDFTDYIDNNPCWEEATGVLTPNSNLSYGTSSWVEDGFGNNGSTDAAKMNIYASRAEWLISESIDLGSGTAYQLEFDVALTDFASTAATTLGADDTAAVVISTDNGVTWSNANVLQMWTAGSEPSATGDRVVIDLSAYSGTIKIGFYAYSSVTAGADNDFFIDNFAILPLASASDLVINEIMYNPPEGGTDTLEFIEIYNNGTSNVNVNNFSLTGVTFTFPNTAIIAGGYYVVATDAAAFNSLFGFMPDAEWTTGGLSNSGETLLLLDAAGNTLDSVRYDDGGVWPAGGATGQPDGGGSSLILCDATTDNADGNNWQASTALAGTNADLDPVFASPGMANTCAAPGTDVAADQFLNLNSTYCNTTAISGGFVITNLSGNDASNVNYNITAGGLPIANGVIPVVLANSSDTIMVGPVPVTTGSATLVAIINAANDTDSSNDTLTQTITVSNVIASATIVNNVSCAGGNDGTISAAGSNGIGNYSYNWNTGDTTDVITGLTAGTYVVTVMDSIGCMAMDSVTLVDPTPIMVTDTVVNISCNGDSTGSIAVLNTMGGSAPYAYMWSTGSMSTAITNLPAGPYTLTITDANGCMTMRNYTITEPMPIMVMDTITNVLCTGDSSGSITITSTMGGNAPYTYLWSNGGTGTSATNLPAGSYDLTVTDANGCMMMWTYTITEPATALSVVIQDNADGSATANATGGTGAYTYLWDANANNQTTMTANNLTNANTYSVTVSDVNGCMAMDTVTIRIIGVQTLENVSKLEMFPNPTSDNVFVNLELNQVQPVQISVYNAIGKRVLVQSLGNTQGTRVELPTAQLPAGVYHVQITIGGEQLTRKLVVRK